MFALRGRNRPPIFKAGRESSDRILKSATARDVTKSKVSKLFFT